MPVRMKAKGPDAAEILIYEDVGADWFGQGLTAKSFADDLKALGKVSAIDVRINSYGGDVFDGLAIYRQLVDHPATITVHIDGMAASIASIIAMAGKRIVMSESGFIMIHDAWGVAMGNAATMRTQADKLEVVTEQLAQVYVARTGQDFAKVREMMRDETWLTAADAVKRGFATETAANMAIAATLDPARHKFRNAPASLIGTPEKDTLRAAHAAQRSRIAATAALRNQKSRARGVGS